MRLIQMCLQSIIFQSPHAYQSTSPRRISGVLVLDDQYRSFMGTATTGIPLSDPCPDTSTKSVSKTVTHSNGLVLVTGQRKANRIQTGSVTKLKTLGKKNDGAVPKGPSQCYRWSNSSLGYVEILWWKDVCKEFAHFTGSSKTGGAVRASD